MGGVRYYGPCVVPGCTEPAVRKKTRLCNKHDQQNRYHGGARPPAVSDRPKPEGCKIPGCPYRHSANGYCYVHNRRWVGRGRPEVFDGGEPFELPTCKLFGCAEEAYLLGYCRNHYQGWTRAGRPDNWRPVPLSVHAKIKPGWKRRRHAQTPTGCKVVGCTRPHFASGYCGPDYGRWRNRGMPPDWIGSEDPKPQEEA